MGLDTSHNCWHGSYSSFGHFRKELAQQIGEDLTEFEGYGEGTKSFDDLDHDIRPLLDHSDCDGELTPEEAKQIAQGLQSIIDNFKECKWMAKYEGEYFIRKCKQFRDGCLQASEAGETIDFH